LPEWARFVLAPLGQEPAKHHQLLITELEAVALGEIDRLMLLLPPGAAKSTYASVLFPAWWFTQHPQSAVIAAAHTHNLAAHFGRRARNLVAEYSDRLGYRLTRDERASSNWSTDKGGSYFAAGVGGPITGRRADLVLVDDPIKSLQQAHSYGRREQIWEWFRGDLTPRLKPGGRIVLVMTRWHPDDLGGRLLAEQAAGGDAWRCLRLPALAEENDPLGRAPGAALWPEWESREALMRKRAVIGERTWSALYQQSPQLAQGLLFKVERIATVEEAEALPPPTARRGKPAMVRAWDLAATAEAERHDPDWTVGLRLWRDPTNRFVIQDVLRFRGGPRAVEQAIIDTAERDGRDVTVALPQDPGQAGRAQVVYFARLLAGFHVTASVESGSKVTRALPVASQAEAGNLVVARAPWNRAFLEELRDFPNGAKDDQVDALSRAFGCLIEAGAPTRELMVPLMHR
jgi:predicted phage terminase large subunit-like protein